MRPLRLAVIFDQKIQSGGGYQQSLNAALLTRRLPSDLCETIYFTTVKENIEALASYGVDASLIYLSFFDKANTYLKRVIKHSYFSKIIKSAWADTALQATLVSQSIDLVYFLSPSGMARDLDRLNYIITVWDLCHRDDPEFPEVRENWQLERRDKKFQSILPGATAVFVDSELGKKNVAHLYGIDQRRVHVMAFQAAAGARALSQAEPRSSINVREKYNLKVPYVIYPAQFWAHKNHIYLLEGLRALQRDYGLSIGAIFSGGDQGNLAYVQSYVRKLNLVDQVRFVGFVGNEEMPALYRQSIALVMPSYFGPTNLPPLEAFELGVPVLYADKPGLRDQVGDAALLMDLTDPGSMARHLAKLVRDEELRLALIKAGKERLKHIDSVDRLCILKSILEDFRWRRACWE